MDLTAILKKGVDDWLAADESRTFEELARLSRMTPEELRGVIVGKWTLTNDLVYLYNIIFPSEIIREIISKYHKNLAWSLKKENGKEIFLAPASEKEESISSQDISIYHYCSAKNKTAKKVIEKLWGRSGYEVYYQAGRAWITGVGWRNSSCSPQKSILLRLRRGV